MKKLILASGSKSRRSLLDNAGIAYEVVPSNYEEDMSQNLTPRTMVSKFAEGKARDVASRVTDAIVLGADTVVVFGEEILGKPLTEEKAVDMLTKLSGNWHVVVTGFCLIDVDTKETYLGVVETKVKFKKLSQEEIIAYVKTGEPLDKSGAYTEQRGSMFIEEMQGDIFNVTGLPLQDIGKVLAEKFGYHYWENWK